MAERTLKEILGNEVSITDRISRLIQEKIERYILFGIPMETPLYCPISQEINCDAPTLIECKEKENR